MKMIQCTQLGSLMILWSSVLAAPAESMRVRFTATIDTSDFVTPGYAVGDVCSGWYDYENSTAPLEIGANGTTYELPGLHLDLGGNPYEAQVGRVNLIHFLPDRTPDATDLYDLFGFTLRGDALEGFHPAAAELRMIDVDNSALLNPPPYLLDLPNPDLFEIKELLVRFLAGPPMVGKELHAGIDAISVESLARVPDASSGLALLALGGGIGWWLRRREYGADHAAE